MRPLSCICGSIVPREGEHADTKCAHCGRVYNGFGQYLWKEDTFNDTPGTGSHMTGEFSDKRAPDQDAAIEEAFVAAKLPEEDRRDVPAKKPKRK